MEDDRMEDDHIGDLALRGLIGPGSRGEVWRAERRGSPGRVLAVKLVDPRRPAPARSPADERSQAGDDSGDDGGDRVRAPQRTALDRIVTALRDAAAALRGVAHPALLPIEDVEVVGTGMIAVVLPYVAGGSLDDVLAMRADRSLPPQVVVRLGADLAGALAAAHAAGLRHGRLSPHDLLFDADGQVLLSGVGLADALEPWAAHPAAPLREAHLEDVRALARLLADAVAGDAGLGPNPLRELLEQAATAPEDLVDDDADRPIDAALLASRLQALRDALPTARNPVGQRCPGAAGILVAAPEGSGPRATPASPQSAAPAATTSVGTVWRWRRRLVGRGSRRGRERRPPVGTSRPHARTPRDRSTRTGPTRPARVGAAVVAVALLAAAAVAGHGARSTADPAARNQTDAAHAPTAPVGPDAPPGARPTPPVPDPSPDARPTSPATASADRLPGNDARSVLRVPPAPCDRVARPPTGARAGASQQVAIVDLDARGCGVSVSYERGQLRMTDPDGRIERFEVSGMDDDAVLLAGDWNCDGHEGIALYLPATGEALRFDRLPAQGGEVRALTEPTRVLHGVASVRVDAAGCAELVVAPP